MSDHAGHQKLVGPCAFIGGATFFVLNLATEGAVPGGAMGGALGGGIGAVVGMLLSSLLPAEAGRLGSGRDGGEG